MAGDLKRFISSRGKKISCCLYLEWKKFSCLKSWTVFLSHSTTEYFFTNGQFTHKRTCNVKLRNWLERFPIQINRTPRTRKSSGETNLPLFVWHFFIHVSLKRMTITDGWTTEDLQYLWKSLEPVQIVKDLHLPRFTLEKYISDYCNIKTNTGNILFILPKKGSLFSCKSTV